MKPKNVEICHTTNNLSI